MNRHFRVLILVLLAAFFIGANSVAQADGDTLYVAADGDNGNDCSSLAPCATIGHAVSEAEAGDTISVVAGSYDENLTIDKQLSIVGAGSGDDDQSNTVIGSSSGTVITLAGSGASVAEPILLQDLRIEPDGHYGINVPGGSVSYVELENVHIVGTDPRENIDPGESGLKVATTASLSDLVVNNSVFDHLTYGWYFAKAVGSGGSNVTNVTVTETSFSHNGVKGIYVEKLSDATFSACIVHNNGIDTTFHNAQWNAGFDINLKGDGAYENISINNCSFTDNAPGAKEGAALAIKARDDGATYGPHPAALTNVSIDGCFVSGNERGIRLGEPNKGNAGPTNVTINNCSFDSNEPDYTGGDGSAYGDVINMSLATVDASGNWLGSNDPTVVEMNVHGAVDFAPLIDVGTDTSADAGFQPDLSSITVHTLGAQVGAAGRVEEGANLAGSSTVNVAAGLYDEDVTVSESVILHGAQFDADVAGRTGGGGAESTISGLVTVDASNVVLNGFSITNPDHSYGIVVDGNTPSYSDIGIVHNIVYDIGSGNYTGNSNLKGIYVERGPDNVSITDNAIHTVGAAAGKSADGIFVGDTGSNDESEGLLIENNTISGILSNHPNGRKGAYGILINNGEGTPNAQILNNSISNLDGGWAHAIGLEGPTPGALVQGNAISNVTDDSVAPELSDAVGVFFEANPDGDTVTIEENQFSDVAFGVAQHPDNLIAYEYAVDATVNWWGFSSGPSDESNGADVGVDVDYSPWCLDEACSETISENEDGEVIVEEGTDDETVQTLLDNAAEGTVIVLPAETLTPDGGFEINTPGVTIKLVDGTVIQASSPCFVINADDTTIDGSGGACVPSDGDPGVEVSTAVNNLVVQGLEIDGAGNGGHGIYIYAAVTDLQIIDNYIHNAVDGLHYTANGVVDGVHEVQGNLFQNNSGDGVNNQSASTYDVSYNSWGHVDGPGSGDGFSGNLTVTPYTHAALRMVSSGSPVADEVGVGEQITYAIQLDANEIWGADFSLNFDETALEVVSITDSGLFDTSCGVSDVATANSSGTISFCGSNNVSGAVNDTGQDVFEVVFEGLAAGDVDLDLDESDDLFSMSPPDGASNNVYASALDDDQVTVVDAASVSGRIDLQGRPDDSGATITLGGGAYGPFADSTVYWGDFNLASVIFDSYDVTVNMDRYLDVTSASGISVDVDDADEVLSTLVLLGGDVDGDDEIRIGDVTTIGGEYGNSGGGIGDVNTDINADGEINILDLALAGGNLDETSDSAYSGWTP